ncbi:MAG: universal stress protein [Bacteroidetes bacterium]|nr:universal stress protein [Bacteroidota bacterium]
MEKDNKLIIIPWDFSEVAENALLHGIKIAKMVHNDICLLHIADKNKTQKEKDEIKQKLDIIAEQTKSGQSINTSVVILQGSIFSIISKYATDQEANLVIMGTHGMKGMQKITGSWALKVIAGSKVPFIVIQDKPTDMGKYQHIVFPVDFRQENKEKLQWAIYLGKYFDSKIHILKARVTDKSLLKKMNTNINFAIKHLIQNNINYEIHTIGKAGHFDKETIKFAHDINADLILIMTTKHIDFSDYILGASEQNIIANSSKIPVMCVNPMTHYAKHGFIGV